MPPLLLSEEDVEDLLSVEEAVPIIEDAFAQQARGAATNRPRSRIAAGAGRELHSMEASADESGVYGFKTYTIVSETVHYFVYLFSAETGELLAVLQAKRLGQVRTGAATAVATSYMARKDASVVGVLGSGFQARTQLEAVCKVRSVSQARVYSPTPGHREAFASEMSGVLGIPVSPVDGPEKAVDGADILAVITSSVTPVFDGAWLGPGTHVVAVGGASPFVREFDETTLQRADLIVVDDLQQTRIESGELMVPASTGVVMWEQVRELWQVVGGEVPGRTGPDDITLFKSLGMALWDVVAAKAVYQKAVARGVGTTLDW